ncbi:MAG: rod shape-determining protein MreC [Flavobacteriaceae bacterium]|jgi:rod shape-determining protein MreC|uniref:rod shape-determining protein MreC n=1 Tax=Candidatus Marifrigoribacter sp. Uisw_064 TaxID=3230970 RepID=UPI003AE110AA
MQQILFFFIRNKNFLLFCVLFLASIGLTIQSHTYHKNKFVTSANFLSGGLYSYKSDITSYFNLRSENNELIEENLRVREQLDFYKKNYYVSDEDSTSILSKYSYVSARVINNSFSKTKNKITLDEGSKNNIELDMGVITSKGIVGIINNTSKNYATIQSILNTDSQINAKLKSSNHFGSLVWNTKNPNIVQLIEIPRLAPIVVGDTIITGGKSTIFPEGILIGTIKDAKLLEDESSYTLNIQLFNDMTNLNHVYIIKNKEREEIKLVEEGEEDAE